MLNQWFSILKGEPDEHIGVSGQFKNFEEWKKMAYHAFRQMMRSKEFDREVIERNLGLLDRIVERLENEEVE